MTEERSRQITRALERILADASAKQFDDIDACPVMCYVSVRSRSDGAGAAARSWIAACDGLDFVSQLKLSIALDGIDQDEVSIEPDMAEDALVFSVIDIEIQDDK